MVEVCHARPAHCHCRSRSRSRGGTQLDAAALHGVWQTGHLLRLQAQHGHRLRLRLVAIRLLLLHYIDDEMRLESGEEVGWLTGD